MQNLTIHYHTNPNTAEWGRIMMYDELAIDIETTGLDPLVNQIVSVQIANPYDDIVDILDMRRGDFRFFINWLTHSFYGTTYYQNAKFDTGFLHANYGYKPNKVYDTWAVECVLTAGTVKGRNSLKRLTEKYLGIEMDKSVRETFTMPLFDTLEMTEEQQRYSALDAWVLPRIAAEQRKNSQDTAIQKIIDLENQLTFVFAQMELRGFYLDSEAWLALAKQAEVATAEYVQNLIRISGEPAANFNSHNDLLRIFKKLGITIPVVQGRETTKEEFIEKLKHPFIKALLEYRDTNKRVTTYGKEFLNFVHPIDGRVHPNFNQFGTDTGRISSDEPNTQNIPGDPRYRRCFKAKPGYKLVCADFVQQELVLMAEVSQDPQLLKAFREGLDIHRLAAANIYNVAYDEVDKEQRTVAKILNFGLAYGSSAWNLANKLNVSDKKAVQLVDDYWERFPVLKKWQRRAGLMALRFGYSETIWGRKRYYGEGLERNSVMRMGANHQIQGSGADMVKRAMVLISARLPEFSDAGIVNQVHDELEVEAKAEEADAVAEMVKQCMEQAGAEIVKSIQQRADVKVATEWEK